MDRGLDSSEQEALEAWLALSHVHGEMLIQMASMWDLMDVLTPIAGLLPLDHSAGDNRFVRRARTGGWPIAASVAILCLTLVFAAQWFQIEPEQPAPDLAVTPNEADLQSSGLTGVEYFTGIGQRSDVMLADGSQIKLNTNTRLTVDFGGDSRQVLLQSGEAYFDVAKNPDKPFVVLANDSRVTAIGTSFGVDMSRVGDTEVLVTEGRVKVDRITDFPIAEQQSLSESVVLTRGQRAQLQPGNTKVSSDVDLDQALAWREGRLIFSGESLAHVVSEIDRYTPLSFKLVDKEIANIPVGGFFKTGDLNVLLHILEQNFGVTSKRVDNTVLLSKAKDT